MKQQSVKCIQWSEILIADPSQYEAFNAALSDTFSIPDPLTKILYNRKIRNLRDFSRLMINSHLILSSPFMFRDMTKAVERIRLALTNKEKILLFGDSDIDGIMGMTILSKTLTQLGYPSIHYALPENDENYGLTVQKIDVAVSNGITLIITVDNGISSYREVDYAKSKGIDVIITDHHNPNESIPDALALINPKTEKGTPCEFLAGTGVAFKLCEALLYSFTRIYQDSFTLLHFSAIQFKSGQDRKKYLNVVETVIVKCAIESVTTISIDMTGFSGNLTESLAMSGQTTTPLFSLGKLFSRTEYAERMRTYYAGKTLIVDDRDFFNEVRLFVTEGTDPSVQLNVKTYAQLTENSPVHLEDIALFASDYPLAGQYPYMKFFFSVRNNYGKLNQFLVSLISFTGIATLADIMPLTGENRMLVTEGLNIINEQKPEFINFLTTELYRLSYPIGASDIVWKISPVFNSPGRFGKGELLLNYFLKTPAESARITLSEIIDLNSKRTNIVESTVASITVKHTDESIVLIEKDNVEPGLTGLLASRYLSLTGKPVIFITKYRDKVSGSMRSHANLNSFSFLQQFSRYFLNFGGHTLACGFTVDTAQYAGFRQDLNATISSAVLDSNPQIEYYDAEIDFEELSSPEFVEWYSKLEPFGEGFKTPLFMTRDIAVSNRTTIGRNNNSLKLTITQDKYSFEAFFFKGNDLMSEHKSKHISTIVYEIQSSTPVYTLNVVDIIME